MLFHENGNWRKAESTQSISGYDIYIYSLCREWEEQ